MFNPPPKDALEKLPPLYANDKAETALEDTILHLHLFVSACNWWIAEFDSDDIFWGFANLGDDECAEWGYISFSELKSIAGTARLIDASTGELTGRLPLFVEWDESWRPKPFRDTQWRKRAE